MSSRLQTIEQRLLAINEAKFQKLSDAYFNQKYHGQIISFSSIGSNTGKEKTTQGTPDTLFRLVDNRLIFVEYTTQQTGLVGKLKRDIDSCLNLKKSGVELEHIHNLVLCFNAQLKAKQENELFEYAQKLRISLELIGIDTLAQDILLEYPWLASFFLDIPFDTGQLLPVDTFVTQYDNQAHQLATPLHNPFLHRKNELDNIKATLETNNLLILSGNAGVGKTKIGIEVLRQLTKENKDYKAFVITQRGANIYDDLRLLIKKQRKYILLIDDANRQFNNLEQILGLFKQFDKTTKGHLKIILTVRSYALRGIQRACNDYQYVHQEILKFSDEEITDIIKSEPFNIKNYEYQRKILRLADGNARLAIMASKIAIEKNLDFLLNEVSELFDYYFGSFLKDVSSLEDENLVSTLGIISFFYSINRKDKGFLNKLLNDFELDYYQFNSAISELHKRELVEIKDGYVRVGEQVMATYFFYKAFFKDKLLPFEILLHSYFDKFSHRFRDTIIPTNNLFGYHRILKVIKPSLDSYISKHRYNEDKLFRFFDVFWAYLGDTILEYFQVKIEDLEIPKNPHYHTKYETNDFAYSKNDTLKFISNFFRQDTEHYEEAIYIAFEYVQKVPDALPELIHNIREIIPFSLDDEYYGFPRQRKLLEFLVQGISQNQKHCITAFYAIAKTFLEHKFRVYGGGRKNTISIYEYRLPLNEYSQNIRLKVWQTLFQLFEKEPDEVFYVIKKYSPFDFREEEVKILAFDLQQLMPFVENHFSSHDLRYIHFVQELLMNLDRSKYKEHPYKHLGDTFTSQEYDWFLLLYRNRRRAKYDYEFDDYKEYEKLKNDDIKRELSFTTIDEFKKLYKIFIEAQELLGNHEINRLYYSLDVVIQSHIPKNEDLAIKMFCYVLDHPCKQVNLLNYTLDTFAKLGSETSDTILNTLKNWKHKQAIYWQLKYLRSFSTDFINEEHYQVFINCINNTTTRLYLNNQHFELFQKINPNVIIDIVRLIVKSDKTISLDFDFFKNYSSFFKTHKKLLLSAYTQQSKLDNHFDYQNTELQAILSIEPSFIYEFLLEEYCKDCSFSDKETRDGIPFVWTLSQFDVEQIANFLVENSERKYTGFAEECLTILFQKTPNDIKDKVNQFILEYIQKYNKDERKMRAIFHVVYEKKRSLLETGLLTLLKYNQDIELFKQLDLTSSGGVYSGDTIIGEVRASEWRSIQKIVQQHPNQFEVRPILRHISKNIKHNLAYAETERDRKFNRGWDY